MTRKVWLILGLAVLLLHISVLHGLSHNLHLNAKTENSQPLTFTTRTLVLPPSHTIVPTPEPDVQRSTTVKSSKTIVQDGLAKEQSVLMVPPQDNTFHSSATDAKKTSQDPPPESDPVQAVIPGNAFQLNADSLPASVKLIYQVDSNKFPFRLRGELLWIASSQQYQAQLSVNALGFSRQQNSRGRIGRSGLLPERFSDKFRSEVAAHFDYDTARVTFSANTPEVALQAGAQDRLSVLIQLAALVASQPQRFEPGSQISIQTVGPRDAAVWIFSFGAQENLDLPSGRRQGIKVVRLPRQPYDQKLEVWLAPSLSYLPARIRITESNGDFIDQLYKESESVQSP